jgi:L-alanine-DL-glutamate epimerase-like enolase superfamily enzyme
VDRRDHVIWELALEIERYTVARQATPPIGEFEPDPALITLYGAGHEGAGEDITPFGEHWEPVIEAAAELQLAGSWTLRSFVEHLATVDQWPVDPAPWEMAVRWRNWAFESAALDLALRQAGLTLHEALGRTPAPLTFVNSLGLGDPPSVETILRRIERYPSVGFKLDAAPTWTPEILGALAATGMVRTIDFKGRYGLEVKDEHALGALYDAVLETFPESVILEDPHEQMMDRVAPVIDRVSFDAPIARAGDITTRTINVKPSRIGSLRALLEIYEHCADHGIRMYGGGMGEQGIARGQIELLASLFHPDSPNDVAPSPFNLADPPPGLPSSPLDPGTPPPGFRLQ